MHRGLGILEIVEMICGQLGSEGPGPPGGASGRALSALARSSKVFLNPALNVLWRNQNTILNILRCMPLDLWDITEPDYDDDDGVTEITLRRIMKASDWERPLLYMHRVRCLSSRIVFDDPEFLETLSLCLPGEFLFPNLEILHWHPGFRPSVFHHIRWLLTPRVRELSMGCDSYSNLSILPTLASKYPLLTHISISMDLITMISMVATHYDCAPSISTFVLGLTHIESLNVPTVDGTALAHLAQIPELRKLHLEYGVPDYVTGPYLGAPGFTNLTDIGVRTMKCALLLLSMVAKCPLVKFAIFPTSFNPTEVIAGEFYQALFEHCSHASLREITLAGEFDEEMAPLSVAQAAVYSVGPDTLRPLFAFTNLVEVRLVHPVGFNLDDASILDMARAWPHIVFLSLIARPHRHIASRVTLEGLYAFAKYCPRLHRLEITFDATVVPNTRDNGQKRVAQQALHHLNVAASLIKKPKRVATFLSALFPSLKSIATLNDDLVNEFSDEEAILELETSSASDRRWKNVEDTLSAL
ncbi:hypothetical protein B0H19DRAFT_1080803 [Mycena capillaripes]|nr:hypothetical protein B0H19DRAFT_1080803 [Mycena capillaripes]